LRNLALDANPGNEEYEIEYSSDTTHPPPVVEQAV